VLPDELSIGDVVHATGLGEATLRAWERRYGFPEPRREPSGHRRYSQADVERLLRVIEERQRGVELPAAIERARGAPLGVPSLFARLRASRPELHPILVRKSMLVKLSHALEDESAARAERSVLIGSFQRERFYRQAQQRWRALATGAELAVVFADFERTRRGGRAPAEVRVDRSHPVAREWGVICVAAEHSACLVAWEPPGRGPAKDLEREFELLLSFDPSAVRDAADAGVAVCASAAPGLAEELRARLADTPAPRAESQLRLAGSVTARLLATLG